MKQFLLLILLSFSSVLTAQNTVGTISISEGVFEGYTLATVATESYLINNCGEVINEWTSEYFPGVSVYLMPNGNLLRPGRVVDGSSNLGFGGRGGIVEMFNWEGDKIWEFVYSSNQFLQHHDVYPLPNGNILILAIEVVSQEDAIQAGRDPNQITEEFLYNEKIIEVVPEGNSGGTIVWEWNVIDHLVQDFDPTKDNFGTIADQPRKINFNYLNGYDPIANWLHVNSIQYNEELDQIVISSRNFCELWVIDHSTTIEEAASDSGGTYGHGGDLLYRWGNPAAYDQGSVTDQKLFGQHTPYIIPPGLPNAGKILLFNNGVRRVPTYSQVFMFTPPTTSPGVYDYANNTAFGPETLDYQYPESIPTEDAEFYSAIVSNAQQLPNGNILVCEGREAIFFELDTDNNIVWEYLLPISNANGAPYPQGGNPPVNSFSFRAIKYAPDYPAFDGRDLTPGDPLELNPDLSACEALSTEDYAFNTIKIFPNPASEEIQISNFPNLKEVVIFDMNGRMVHNSRTSKIDIRHLNKGLYFVQLLGDSNQFTTKVIKQ